MDTVRYSYMMDFFIQHERCAGLVIVLEENVKQSKVRCVGTHPVVTKAICQHNPPFLLPIICVASTHTIYSQRGSQAVAVLAWVSGEIRSPIAVLTCLSVEYVCRWVQRGTPLCTS